MLRLPKKLTADANVNLGNQITDIRAQLAKVVQAAKGFNGVTQQANQVAAALGRMMTYVDAAQKKFDADLDAPAAADLDAPDVIVR